MAANRESLTDQGMAQVFTVSYLMKPEKLVLGVADRKIYTYN